MEKSIPQFLGESWAKLDQLIDLLDPTSIFVLTDDNTHLHCLSIFKEKFNFHFTELTIPSGEINKCLKTAETIWQFLADNGGDRQSLLINLGGGVVTDIGAFCAATYMRGIRYIQMPTSVLAMTDAAIGGKTGIDLGHLKNYIGTFSQTEGVFIYPDFINTLPEVEQVNGLGEIIKHAILDGGDLWSFIKEKPSLKTINWLHTLKLSTQIKVNIVQQDQKEKGLRKVLNLGHTFGHAFESYSLLHDPEPLRHGEAVALGIICATIMSDSQFGLDKVQQESIIEVVNYYFETPRFNKSTWETLYEIMQKDKKNQNGEIKVILFDKIGQPKWDIGLDKEEFYSILEKINLF